MIVRKTSFNIPLNYAPKIMITFYEGEDYLDLVAAPNRPSILGETGELFRT